MLQRERARPRALTVGVAVLAALVVAATFARLFFGVDFIDEAFYAATAARFASGARPFVDDFDMHQLAALLTAPWAWLHLSLVGDTTGIMLSMRMLWACLNGVTAFLAYRYLRRITDSSIALLCAVAGFAVMPYMIPAPSYNTLGVMFGSMAVSLIAAAAVDGEQRPWTYLTAGALLGLAVFAYPTLVVAALLAVLAVRYLTGSWRQAIWTATGGIATAVGGACALAPTMSVVQPMLDFNLPISRYFDWGGASQGGPMMKALGVSITIGFEGAVSASVWLSGAVAALQLLRKSVPWWLSLALAIAVPFGFSAAPDVRTLTFCISALVAAALVIATYRPMSARDAKTMTRTLRFCVMYGGVSGMVFALTSGVGSYFLGLGGAGVLPACLAVIALRVRASLRGVSLGVLSRALPAGAIMVSLVALTWFNWTGYYRDASPIELDTLVRSGPHAGLYTTEENARESEALWATLRTLSAEHDRVFVYHGLPAGYLFTPAKPSTPLLWSISYDAQGLAAPTEKILADLQAPGQAPTVVIKNLGWPDESVLLQNATSGYDPTTDRVERFVQTRYRSAARGTHWEVLVPD